MMKVGTHDQLFHPDEVVACATLDRCKNIDIIRTRDLCKIAECDIVVDVGGVYDPEKGRFDHHQYKGRGEKPPTYNGETPMSSAGMVWKHYGKEFVSKCGKFSDELCTRIANEVYEKFIRSVDYEDNFGRQRASIGKISRSTLTDFIRMKNTSDVFGEEQNEAFLDAVQFAKRFLTRIVEISHRDITNYSIQDATVRHAVTRRFDVHPSGHYIVLDKYCGDSRKIICGIDDPSVEVLFIIYGERARWRAIAQSCDSGKIQIPKLYMPKLQTEIDDALADIQHDDKTFSAGWTAGSNTIEALIALGEFARRGRSHSEVVWDAKYQAAKKTFHDSIETLQKNADLLEQLQKNKS